MRAGQVAGAHQKFADNFAAHEFEVFFKQRHPFFFGARMVHIEPVFKRAAFLPYPPDLLRVVNGGVDFQTVADDACVGKQPFAVGIAESGDGLDVEAFIGRLKRLPLLQNQGPAQARLIDFQHQPLKQSVVVFNRETVLFRMILFVRIVAVFGQVVGKVAIIHGFCPSMYSNAVCGKCCRR